MSKHRPRKAARKGRGWPEEKRQEALAIYVAEGPKAAARQTRIPEGTISSWARRAGLKTRSASTAQKATEAAKAKAELRRAGLREEILAKAEEVLRRISSPQVDFRGKDGKRVELPVPSPTGTRELAVAFGVLLDKYRLEMGESTDRRTMEHAGDVTLRQVPDDQLNDALTRLLSQLERKG